MSNFTRIYVAGHTGLVGSHIVARLQDLGYKNLILKTHQELDLTDQLAVSNFFKIEKPEQVILTAAKVGGIMANKNNQAEFLYENLQIQNNVIWQALINEVDKLFFLASSCVYPSSCLQPIKEEYLWSGPLEQTNEGYAIAKIAGIEFCKFISRQYKKQFSSFMPTNIYGPNDNFDLTNGHVIPALLKRFHIAKVNNEKSVKIWGTGEVRREFMYVEDFADAICWLMENYDQTNMINIGTGVDVTIKELAYKIKEIVGYGGAIEFDTTKPDGMKRKLLDVSKLNSLGWKYKTELDIGLSLTYNWCLNNDIFNEKNY